MLPLPLKDPTNFFNKVQIFTYLDHLTSRCSGLEATDVINLHFAMLDWWVEDPRVPENMNHLEDAKNKAAPPLQPCCNWQQGAFPNSA
jgi:hypothetical protein